MNARLTLLIRSSLKSTLFCRCGEGGDAGDSWYALGTSFPSKLNPITQPSMCTDEFTCVLFEA